MPTLNLDRYAQDMRALAPLLTDAKPGGRRVQRVKSTAISDVTIVAGTLSVTMLVQESGLYIKGFFTPHGRWYFKDSGLGANELKFSCSYVGSNSLGIFSDSANPEIARLRTMANLTESVRALSDFRGGNDLHLKIPLATMAFLVSEAIRFTIVYDRMVETCKNQGGRFSFGELQPYVQNWGDLSEGKRVPGTNPDKVFTAHG